MGGELQPRAAARARVCVCACVRARVCVCMFVLAMWLCAGEGVPVVARWKDARRGRAVAPPLLYGRAVAPCRIREGTGQPATLQRVLSVLLRVNRSGEPLPYLP